MKCKALTERKVKERVESQGVRNGVVNQHYRKLSLRSMLSKIIKTKTLSNSPKKISETVPDE